MSEAATVSPSDIDSRSHRLGVVLCLTALFVFACQDGVTKVLIRDYSVAQIVMVRFWVFAAFAVVFVSMRGGVAAATRSRRPMLQMVRSLLFVGEIALFAFGLHYLGLAESHALFATFPLIATALAIPILGEKVGWRRWIGVAVGFVGALVIIRPGLGLFQPAGLIALACAFCFALYSLMTRLASFRDSFETSTLYMAVIGCLAATIVGLPLWRAPDANGWGLLVLISILGTFGHMLLVKALQYAPASLLQPFNYTLLVWASLIGFAVFEEIPDLWTVAGAGLTWDYDSRDDRDGENPLLPNDQLRYLLGYEWEAKPNFTVGLQYYIEWTLDHDALMANSPYPQYEPDEFRHLLTNRLTYRAGRDKYTWSLFTFFSPSDSDFYLRPVFTYRHSDTWSLTAGANLFGGSDEHTFFNQLQDASNAYLRFKYSY